MKLFVSGNCEEDLTKYNLVNEIKLADTVLILPGGLGCFKDLFDAID